MLDAVASRDTALLAALRRDLDATVFQDILAVLGEELARRLCSARMEGREWHALREDVQATLSLAATFDFGRLADLSRAVLASRSCSAHGFFRSTAPVFGRDAASAGVGSHRKPPPSGDAAG